MNCYIIEEFETFSKVCFYTIYKDGDVYTETDKFYARFLGEDGWHTEEDLTFEEDFDDINNLIEVIGDKHGAKSMFFRHEKAAHALPSKPSKRIATIVGTEFSGNQLRLYCIRLTDEVVILGNGGIKTSQRAQDSPDLADKFDLINKIAKKIDKAIIDKDIRIEGKEIKGDLVFYF